MKRNLLTLVVTMVLGASLASAQASRTWVSGVGDDANPCSRTAPCKTFAGAISKTAAGGEIDALDPAGYGALTITKGITIDGGGGQVASVLVSGTNGIVVQANAATDVVILRNLRINGIGTGINGILFNSGKALVVQNCDIFGFTQNGINITGAGSKVIVDTTTSRNNGLAGLVVQATALTTVAVNHSQFDLNTQGLFAGNFSQITANDTSADSNSQVGFIAANAAGTAELNLIRSSAANNTVGVQAGGGTNSGTVRVADVALHGNGNGFAVGINGSNIKSFGNNYNSGGGVPTAPNLAQQ